MKYKTLCYSTGVNGTCQTLVHAFERLDKEVAIGIEQGWEPLGGVCVAINPAQGVVAQALIYRERKDTEQRT